MIKEKIPKSIRLVLFGIFIGIVLTEFTIYFLKDKKIYENNDIFISKPLVNVNNTTWTTANLPSELLIDYYNIENNYYLSKKYFVEQLSLRLYLSNEKETDKIPKINELLKVSIVKEEDIKNYYDNLVKKYGNSYIKENSYKAIKKQLEMQIYHDKLNQMIKKKTEEMYTSGKVKLLMDPPLGIPTNLNLTELPSIGKNNSNYIFISLLDYLDPNLSETENKLEKIYKKYSDKIKFVNVIYTKNNNEIGVSFAKGAYCANEQGYEYFWKFHHLCVEKKLENFKKNSLFNSNENLTSEVFNLARSSNLNLEKFNKCLNSSHINNLMRDIRNQILSSNEEPANFYLNRWPIRLSIHDIEKKLEQEIK